MIDIIGTVISLEVDLHSRDWNVSGSWSREASVGNTSDVQMAKSSWLQLLSCFHYH